MIGAVRNEQTIGSRVGEYFSGEVKRSDFLFLRQLEGDGRLFQLSFVFLHEFLDTCIHKLEVALPGRIATVVSIGIDQHQCRPGGDHVGVPELVIGVVEDGVLDVMSLRTGCLMS